MAISEYKNGHFEEIGAWSQILQIVGNSTPLDTHDTRPLGLSSYGNGKFIALIYICEYWFWKHVQFGNTFSCPGKEFYRWRC